MVKENTPTPMGLCMMVNGNKTKCVAMESNTGPLERSILANGPQTICMVSASTSTMTK